MNKIFFAVVALCLIIFVLPAAGVIADVSSARAQGAGLISSADPSSYNHKVSFSFSVWLDSSSNINGNFQAFDQEDKVHVRGQPTSYPFTGIDTVGGNGWMYGSCTVNGVEGFFFELAFWDYREKVTLYTDWVIVRVYDGDWTLIHEWWSSLQVGNIRVEMP